MHAVVILCHKRKTQECHSLRKEPAPQSAGTAAGSSVSFASWMNRLLLGWLLTFSILWALCRHLASPMTLMLRRWLPIMFCSEPSHPIPMCRRTQYRNHALLIFLSEIQLFLSFLYQGRNV